MPRSPLQRRSRESGSCSGRGRIASHDPGHHLARQPWAPAVAAVGRKFFGINLIHFFDEKKDGAAGNSIVCFAASNPCHAI